jgi:hypothetical protein
MRALDAPTLLTQQQQIVTSCQLISFTLDVNASDIGASNTRFPRKSEG